MKISQTALLQAVNEPLTEMGGTFSDPKVVAALLDGGAGNPRRQPTPMETPPLIHIAGAVPSYVEVAKLLIDHGGTDSIFPTTTARLR